MPMRRERYPADWRAISRHIRFDRAGGCCEQCGVRHGAIGARDRDGRWHDEDSIHSMNSTDGEMRFGEFPRMVKVVLTTAHLDHDTTHNADDNLMAMCQRCHLRHDADQHRASAAETRRRRKVKTGQTELELM